ncbi:MAG: hypothetical protein ACI8QZ_002161 [Chlamydiales bacterium]|jgi:hypothetical protein
MTTGSHLTTLLPAVRSAIQLALLGWLSLACLACSTTLPAGEGVPPADMASDPETDADPDAAAKAERKRKEKARAKTREVEKKERALHVAQLELKLARRAADEDATEHEWAVAQAARKAGDTERNLARFGELEQPLKQAERVLAVDLAERRVHDARTDLAGILAIYEEETEASSKDEIIARHRRTVEFAERSLAIAQQKAELGLRTDEQERERELNVEVAKAQRAVEHEQHAKEQGRVNSELDLMKKEHALVVIEEELQDLRGAVRKLKKAPSK